MLGPVFPRPETVGEVCRVGVCFLPQLKLFDFVEEHLSNSTEALKSEIDAMEQQMSASNPLIFQVSVVSECAWVESTARDIYMHALARTRIHAC